MMNIAYIFPGQGTQYPGMGASLCSRSAIARDIFGKARSALGYDIAELGARELKQTSYVQPAVFTYSYAHLIAFQEAYRQRHGRDAQFEVVLGHSLGEYAALVAAGALSFEDALQLVKKRGELMARYNKEHEGNKGRLYAVQIADFAANLSIVQRICGEHKVEIALYNSPMQLVIGGEEASLQNAAREIRDVLQTKITPLQVDGPFHTSFMEVYAQQFREFAQSFSFNQPAKLWLPNSKGDFFCEGDDISDMLAMQICRPVLFMHSVKNLVAHGIDFVIEFGGSLDIRTGAKKRLVADLVQCNLDVMPDKRGKAVRVLGVVDEASLEETIEKYGGGN